MLIETTNVIAVLVTAFIPLILGTLWYSSLLFGKVWMKLEGFQEGEDKKPMLNKIIISYLTYFLMAYAISILVNYLVVASVLPALTLGLVLWLGFAVPAGITNYVWSLQEKPWKLYFIQTSYFLVSILLMSVTLALWI